MVSDTTRCSQNRDTVLKQLLFAMFQRTSPQVLQSSETFAWPLTRTQHVNVQPRETLKPHELATSDHDTRLVKMVLLLHDGIWFTCHNDPEILRQAKRVIKDVMENSVQLSVPLVVDFE